MGHIMRRHLSYGCIMTHGLVNGSVREKNFVVDVLVRGWIFNISVSMREIIFPSGVSKRESLFFTIILP